MQLRRKHLLLLLLLLLLRRLRKFNLLRNLLLNLKQHQLLL